MKKNILWISPYAPYDKVRHAGGKIENFYIKNLQKSGQFNIHLISCYYSSEKEFLDLDEYGISNSLYEISSKQSKQLIKKIFNIESTLNPFNRHAGLLQNYTESILKKGIKEFFCTTKKLNPDIIILQWTETALLLDYIKKFFPKQKIVIIEEDVAFLGYKRKYEYAGSFIRKQFARWRYDIIKKAELKALKNADLIIVNNFKDKNLLVDNTILEKKIFTWSPYFDNYEYITRQKAQKNIVFFGAMSRQENYLSAIWFIENVFNRLSDKECTFLVIGNNPPEQLIKLSSSRIKILGFVEDVTQYFASALCLVAPLVLGAGIKIKILEAFSAGLPVLTNDIGIEGIPAQAGKDYVHCNTVEDYIRNIDYLLNNLDIQAQISKNAREFISQHYNLNNDLINLNNRLTDLLDG